MFPVAHESIADPFISCFFLFVESYSGREIFYENFMVRRGGL